MTDILAVYTTIDTREKAQALARTLVERRLAACAHISEIDSCYRWNGVVENANEFRLALKTSANRYEALAEAIRTLHSYATPEIYAQPLAQVDALYAQWVRECTDTQD